MYEEQPSSSRPLKVALLVLFFVLLAVLVLVILTQKGLLGKKMGTVVQSPTTSQPKTGTTTPAAPSPEAAKQTENGGQSVLPVSSTPTVSMEDAQKQFKAIQDQVNAGTLSQEEAKKQIDALSAQIVPPALPPEAKK